MKKATGEQQPVEYAVDCPNCGATSYSDVNKGWSNLDYGDGAPCGVLTCDECNEDFEMSINT